jgi:hypothetical protein
MFVRQPSETHPGSIGPNYAEQLQPRSSQTVFWQKTLQHVEIWAMYVMVHLLSRPCFICFVARASTESTSTIILTIIFVIVVVVGIFIYISRR